MIPPSIELYGLSLRGPESAAHGVLPAGGEMLDQLLETFSDRFPAAGLMVLSTCVRLEFYVEACASHSEMLHETLASVQGDTQCPVTDMLSYELHDAAVAGHVFRIATGLESPILGDVHVMSQLRVAQAAARKAGSLRPQLSELVRRALLVGKRVRRETAISAGGASVGSAVARMVAAELPARPDLTALVVGAGPAAASVTDALVQSGAFHRIDIANRSLAHAQPLADRSGGRVIALSEAQRAIANADLVISAVAPGTTVLDSAAASDVARSNPDLIIVDLVPGRSVHPYPDLIVKTMDDLIDWSDPRRLAAVEAVEDRCEDALSGWERWYEARPVEELLAQLYTGIDQVIDDLAQAVGPATKPTEQERIAAGAVLKAWLHPHVVGVRQLTQAALNDQNSQSKEHLKCAR